MSALLKLFVAMGVKMALFFTLPLGLGFLLGKGGMTPLSKEEIEQIKSLRFPKAYKYLYAVGAYTCLIIGILFMIASFVILFAIPTISESHFIIFLTLIFSGMLSFTLLGCSLSALILWFISPKSFKQYILKDQVRKGWGYSYVSSFLAYLRVGVIIFIVWSIALLIHFILRIL